MNKKKPQMKQETKIDIVLRSVRRITFYTTPDELSTFKEYGKIIADMDTNGRYDLYVDPRFDFEEVVTYLSNL